MIFDLPRSASFNGHEWPLNTDFRDVLRVLLAFDDPDLTDAEKAYLCLRNMYPDFERIPRDEYQAAFDAALAFIDRGQEGEPGPRTMDWEQDAHMLFPAINHVAGCEVRAVPYLHWWTFVGYFMEIRDCTAATVLGLRHKRAHGEKLEAWEKKYWAQNSRICKLKRKLTEEERAEDERLKKLLG